MTTATVPEAGIASRRGPLEERLGRRDEVLAGEAQQVLTVRSEDLDRGQGDRGGEGVGDQQVVLEVVGAVAARGAQWIVRRRDDDGRGRDCGSRGGDRGGLMSAPDACRHGRSGNHRQRNQGKQAGPWHGTPPVSRVVPPVSPSCGSDVASGVICGVPNQC